LDAGGAIDVHGHLPPAPWDVPDLDPVGLAGAQALRGVAHTVVSSIEGIAAHAPTGNAATAAACAAEPRLLGYLVADPGNLEATRADLRRWGDAPGVVGVKVHCEWSGYPTASAEIGALFDVLADHGRPVKMHVAGAGWEAALERIAHRYPTLHIVAAHAGPGTPSLAMARIVASTVNVHLELCSSFASLREMRAAVTLAGPERVMFGSDAPLLETAFVVGSYHDAGYTPATHPGVFWGNAKRIYGLGGSA
jgi:predicted TIM-barrel fold metal-dependent hydrolase